MIEIYLKTNTNYDKNGDITLDPTSCIYKDSESLVTLEHFIDDEGRYKYIEFENVIAAEENGKKKLYRIYNVVKSLYSVTAYARPIFYDLMDKVLLDVRPTKKIAQEALDIILEGTGFTGHSNLSSINTSYYIRKNIVEALIGDIENSFLNRWGGEFYCENFDVYINDRIGADNGVRVEFGYNLNEIEEDVNIEEVVTRIIPLGYNGIMLDGDTQWVDSPLINKYTQPKMRVIEFSDVKVKENSEDEEGFETIEEARAELIRQCKLLFENGIDKPAVNYKIDMINLANTTAYKDFEMLVNVNKGDTVTCYIPHLGIDVKARVIDYEKDLLTGEYISIELGNATNDFFKNQSDIQNKVDNIFNSNGSVKAETLEGAINALQTKFKALRDIAQPQSVRAILFEDRIEDSPTFGCMCLGTMGFEIASSFKPGTTEWDFRTFGTGKGFVADYIITGVLNAALIKAGILKSENEKTWINMEDGTFNFVDKIKFDGKNFDIDLSDKGLASDGDIKKLQTQITANADGIKEKVSADYVSQEITKSAESTIFKFSNSGGANLLRNSRGLKGNTDYWSIQSYTPEGSIVTTPEFYVRNDEWMGYETGFCLRVDKCINGTVRFEQTIETVVGKTYTFSALVAGHRSDKNFFCRANNSWDWLNGYSCGYIEGGTDINNWVKVAYSFTATTTTTVIACEIWNVEDNGLLWLRDAMVNEGTMPLPWQPHREETYNSSVTIDNIGVGIVNGALKVVNSNSQVVIDGQYNIHKIIATGLLDCNMPSGIQSREFYITHNFGYIPHFAMEQQLNWDGKSVPLPAFTMGGVAANNDTLSFNMIIRCWATTTRLYVNIMRSPVRAAKEDNIKVRYFLYKEVAF